MKRIFLLVLGIPIGFLAVVAVISRVVPDSPPKDFLITKNFLDLKQVDFFTKFRSCNGHKTVSQFAGEPPSNMQHYIGTRVKFGEENKFKIFAPFDAYLLASSPFTISEGLTFVPKSSKFPWWPFNQWRFNLPHTHSLPEYKGVLIRKVKAGELVGYGDTDLKDKEQGSGPIFETQVRIGPLALPPDCKDNNCEPFIRLDSVFNYMSADVFSEYQNEMPGLRNSNDMITTKDFRLSHPCTYQSNGPFFLTSEEDFSQGAVFLGIGFNNPEKIKSRIENMYRCYSSNNFAECSVSD